MDLNQKRIMTLLSEVQLRSRETPNNQLKKRKKSKKRRRLANGDVCEDAKEENSCTDLYKAAQNQLKEEMEAAGMVGTLPLSFGGSTKLKTSKERKRKIQKIEQLHESEENEMTTYASKCKKVDFEEEEENSDDKNVVQVAEKKASIVVTEAVDEVRVMNISNEEVMEQVIKQVEVIEGSILENQSIRVLKHENSTSNSKNSRCPVPKDVAKFYVQRDILFEKFNDGILLDHESWYSVTPQIIAEHIAKRLACDVVIDPFSGCGGNIIQLAMTCKQVIAIDVDPEKIRMAKHNATIYGVAHKIEFIVGDSINLLAKLKADVVFLSPPWGGLKYNRKQFKLENMLVNGLTGQELFAKARLVSKNIAYYLPKGTPVEDLEALTPGETVECEKIFLNKQLKVLTAYYGDLAGSISDVDDALPNEETN
ncbi:trimethylguanosine synthase [Plasmopara halstedii]|uniref:Trimethylguanosine synthase n=1 Tax=Plasmopara halstedii TaxID=4781 RepID=A0A0P1ADB2_PLAHL|nr:trimethylguanosine synthase [Plasmopara halstedii]CEG38472.1 trimethylguanosine synthase [Plasmopara halstedii]|eukprot:XP_024574841.1 trimethylguanosine synthase [Plasmopara halstedii]